MESIVLKKLDNFFASFPTYNYKKGEIIIPANSEPSGVFYIEEGVVRCYLISQEGSEITLNMYKPHTFLPMSWAIANIPNTRFYEAMTLVKAKRASKDMFITFLQKTPEIMYDLLKRIYIGMEGLWMHIESLTNASSYTKLVSSLIILANRFGKTENNETVIQLKMTESDIANYAGVSRETASRELQKLKKENLVSFEKGTILIYDIRNLEDILS